MEKRETYLGHWCLTEKKDIDKCKSYPGELVIESDSSITLKLMGEPDQLNKNLYNINEQEFVKVIIGVAKNTRTNKDHSFTLINSIVSGFRKSTLTEIELKSSYALIDHQIEDFEKFRIGQIGVHCRFLEEWIGVTGHKRKKKTSEDDPFAEYEYHLVDPIPLYDNKDMQLDLRFSVRAPILLKKDVVISESSYLLIRFNNRQNIDTVFELVEKINNFFSFAIGEPVPIDSIELMQHSTKSKESIDNKNNYKFKLIRKLSKRYTTQENIRKEAMLIPYDVLKAKNFNIIGPWIEKYDEYRHALNLYFGKIYSKSQYEENAFLDIVFSIEVLHRVIFREHNGKSRKYKDKLKKILLKLQQNDKEWLLKRLGKKNEMTLLNRFEHIEEEFRPIVEKIFKNPITTFERIVTTRNFLVHYEIHEELKHKVIPSNRLYKYSNKLTVLFQAMLIFGLTGDMSIVIDRIDQSSINKIYIRYKEN